MLQKAWNKIAQSKPYQHVKKADEAVQGFVKKHHKPMIVIAAIADVALFAWFLQRVRARGIAEGIKQAGDKIIVTTDDPEAVQALAKQAKASSVQVKPSGESEMSHSNQAVLAAANRMLKRSRQRRDFAMASSVADEFFTAIISVNHRDNIEPTIKMAENSGLEATLYAQTKIAITGPRDKVLKFQATIRQKLFGEDLQDQTVKDLSHDLIAMSHDLPPSKLKMKVQMAASELSSLHPVSAVRMKQHRELAQDVAKMTGYEMGWRGAVKGAVGGAATGAIYGGSAGGSIGALPGGAGILPGALGGAYIGGGIGGIAGAIGGYAKEEGEKREAAKQAREIQRAAENSKGHGNKGPSDLHGAHQTTMNALKEGGHKQIGQTIKSPHAHISNMEDEKGQKYHFLTTKDHATGGHVSIHGGSGHWDESKHPRGEGGKWE